jgi:hypothetical protein
VQVAQGYVHELQRERGLTNGLLGGQRDYRDQLDQERGRVDQSRGELDRALRVAPPGVSASVSGALDSLANLGDIRAEVDAGVADRAQTLNYFTTSRPGRSPGRCGCSRATRSRRPGRGCTNRR